MSATETPLKRVAYYKGCLASLSAKELDSSTKALAPMVGLELVEQDVPRRSVHLGLRIGTRVPGVLTAGTFFKGRSKTYCVFGRADTVSVIHCRGAKFDRVIVELDEPGRRVLGALTFA